jgi:hypothetical protein
VHERLGVVKLVFAILVFMGCLVMALGAAGLATSQSVTSETTSHTPSSANSTERAQDEIEAKYRQVADQAVADYPELGDKDSKAFSMVSALIHSNVQAGMPPDEALRAAVKNWAESEGRLPHQSATKQEPIKGAPQASANSTVAAESDLNTLNVDRFRDNGDDTVTDTKTGLQWKRCYEGQSLSNGICLGEPKKFSWYSAVKRFKKTSFAGKNDWRLPSIEELSTLVFCPKNIRTNLNACDGHYQRPTLNTKAFPSDYAPWVWSGSSRSSESVFAMYVYFGNGEEHWDPKDSAHTVRLVRSQ